MGHMLLNILSFNCKGINSSFNDIVHEIKHFSHIAFLCEHWLRPCEIPGTKQLLAQENMISSFKSSIDPEEPLIGRPFGGVGFICKKVNGIVYKFTDIENDRLSAVKLIQKGTGKTLLNIIGVYMPYFNGCADQTLKYVSTIDQLQSVIDDCSDAPIMIVGDMNTTLPKHSLTRLWYKCRPFNRHSCLLYDFLRNNDFTVANFAFDQSTNHTYEMNEQKSYIDHVFVSSYSLENVSNCKIVCEDIDWASDHLPIRTQYKIYLTNSSDHQPTGTAQETSAAPKFTRIDWENPQNLYDYQKYINEDLYNLCDFYLEKDNITNCETAQCFIDKYYNLIVKTIHKSCTTIKSNISQNRPKRVPWWSNDCTIARDKVRFWRFLWIKCDKNRNNYVFRTYKYVKKIYRNVRRQAISMFHRNNFNLLSNLFKHGNSKKFWSRVRRCKASGDLNCNDIGINSLKNFFEDKFTLNNQCHNATIDNAEASVRYKYSGLKQNIYQMSRFNSNIIVKFIKKLKSGRAPGYDGITPEHLKHSVNTKVPELISGIFNICINFGVIPEAFKIGTLIPILKKSNLDSTVPGNYRPIILSSVISKLLEYCILEDMSAYEFCDLQFGFIEGRSAAMAICNAVDVIKYFNKRGSPVFACSLDAEKAFDAIPHSVLLYKASTVLKDHWWRLLYTWYTNLVAVIKWNNEISSVFKLYKGTRQGGLTSPFLFNLLYKELINGISNLTCGMKIDKYSFNVFCYADDILLTSATSSGLQKLIDFANSYVSSHGLSFNAAKSSSIVFGKCHLEPSPTWSINNCTINTVSEIDYLGAILCNSGESHVNRRIRKCRQAFYSLQGAGMCENGVEPSVISHLWQTALQTILLYSNECFQLSRSSKNDLEKIQSKLIKSSLGLSKFSRSSPLLSALGIRKIDSLINCQSLHLFSSIMLSKTRTCSLYKSFIRNNYESGLVGRVHELCMKNSISFVKVSMDKLYCKKVCKNLKNIPTGNGLIDSCRTLLSNFNSSNREMLRVLLRSF